MIKVTTVGPSDIQTKHNLFRERGALCKDWVCHSSQFELYKLIYDAWPSNCMYDLMDNYWHRIAEPFLAPIDLGDGIKLSPAKFMEMVEIQFKDQEYGYNEVVEYLKQLVSDEAGVYKFMVSMEKISDQKNKKRY
jgi:hypothetical protein